MKLRHITELISPNGTKETLQADFPTFPVTIGRSGGCNIMLADSSVALEHAVLKETESGISIEGLSSVAGIRINGSVSSGTILKSGDEIGIGIYSFKVAVEGQVCILNERRAVSIVQQEIPLSDLSKLNVSSYLPSMFTISLILSLAILVVYGIFPLSGGSRKSWNSGPMSMNHKLLSDRCESCHANAFTRVEDKSCTQCHELTKHSAELSRVVDSGGHLNPRCINCHFEHQAGVNLSLRDDRTCINCHANLKGNFSESNSSDISIWERHPEFRVSLPTGNLVGGKPETHRVSLDKKDSLQDETPIKLNHHVHLKEGIDGPTGPITMKCNDCHHLSGDLKTIQPITFERDCKSCHTLGFDERLKSVQVPHGDPDVVYNFIYAEYAKFYLRDRNSQPPPPQPSRFRPGQNVEPPPQINFESKEAVEKEARSAEKLIFEKTACQLCHKIDTVPDPLPNRSHYSVTRPNIPDRWFPASTFSHGAHEEIQCLSCHENVKDSKKTSDILLPGVKDCTGCHSKSGAATDCITCHSFHDSLPLENSRKREISDILNRSAPKI